MKLLNQYQVLDTLPETRFDEIAQLAADICDTPIALIGLVDETKEWFKSKIGINVSEIPRNLAFGSHTILEKEILIIPDTLQDERFVNHPLVISHPHCRFYAGVPLINAQGFALGSLCVMDIIPRTLSVTQTKGLKGLAKQVIRLLDLHQDKFLENGQCNYHLLFTHHPIPMWIYNCHAEREKLIRKVSERIHQSLHLQDILNATVEEVRDLLQVDRVVVYQFYPDMSGKIMAESVLSGWTVTLDQDIQDNCFQEEVISNYYQGRKRAISNIYQASLADCHIQLLERFEVKANLVVPILLEINEENRGSSLWGLLIAHQCSHFREWEENQLDLLDQLRIQIAIAIQQSNILQQAKSELEQREQAEIKLRSALAEKEILLKEVHHRVKNNLQIVSSLLHLQAQTIQDPQILKAIQDSQNRIESISLIHKNLYTNPNIGKIDIAEYINNLVTGILISYQITPGQISLQTDIDSVVLNVDQGIACGLIINELISNALKHAFPNNQTGEISISLHKNKNYDIEIRIGDNGIGLADNINWDTTTSLGLSLVYDLVTEQLEGSVTIERNQGTIFNIQFSQFTLHE